MSQPAPGARSAVGTARSPKDWSTRDTGPETEMAAGVGALGTAMAKQRTPISCSSRAFSSAVT